MNRSRLRGVLAERGMRQWELAKRVGYAPSTFSEYMSGAKQAPTGLVDRIEAELRLEPGALGRENPS